jgi:hypothetical protein
MGGGGDEGEMREMREVEKGEEKGGGEGGRRRGVNMSTCVSVLHMVSFFPTQPCVYLCVLYLCIVHRMNL